MLAIKLADLRKASMRTPGLFQAAIEAGKLCGDHVQIEREAFDKLNDRFFNGIKIGSLMHKALAVPVSLIDAALGTDFQDCGHCAIREMKMNGLTVKM